MRRKLIALMLACAAIGTATAQVSVDIGVNLPGVNIGINIPSYPQLVRVPSYPVYYAPGVQANLFFYDGRYWVYDADNWYESAWYNGPWVLVRPAYVPLFVLRVPVRYYRAPPVYFGSWQRDAPPRWGDHWGRDWQRQHAGWDRWNRNAVPAPAPLPVYQRQYSGNRYPPVDRQRALQSQNYRYQPRDANVRPQARQAAVPRAPVERERPAGPREQRPVPPQGAPQAQAPVRQAPPEPRGAENGQRGRGGPPDRPPQARAVPAQAVPQPAPARPEPPAGRPAPRGPAPAAQPPHDNPGQGHGRGPGPEKDHGEGRGQDKKN